MDGSFWKVQIPVSFVSSCVSSVVPDMQEVQTSYRLWMKSMLVHYNPVHTEHPEIYKRTARNVTEVIEGRSYPI